MDSVTVEAPCRIHIALCDLGRVTLRAYGGIGFALATPHVRLRLQRGSSEIDLLPPIDETMAAQVSRLHSDLTALAGGSPFGVCLEACPNQHSGLGSKTAVLLALIQGASELLGLGLSVEQMQRLSQRGGTSGIGLYSFFTGGVIWDAGHPQRDVEELLPSSARAPLRPPTCLGRMTFPEEWAVYLIDPEGKHPCGEAERDIFRRSTPTPRAEVLEAMGHVAHGIAPAFRETNLPDLASGLRAISAVGFKAREIAFQSESVRATLATLQEAGLAAGMSSLGPTLYAITEATDQDSRRRVQEIAASFGCRARCTSGQNSGASVFPS